MLKNIWQCQEANTEDINHYSKTKFSSNASVAGISEGKMRGEVSAQRAPPLPLCARHSLCQSLACPVHAHIHWIEKWGGPDLRKSSFVLCETC